MKISIPSLFLKMTIIGLIGYSVYLLLLQFIFSYLNQSAKGPKLTILNFVGPFLITILIMLFAGLKTLFKNVLTIKIFTNSIVSIILTILLFVLVAWQIWYLIMLYKNRNGIDLSNLLLGLMPMTVGLIATLFFVTKAVRQLLVLKQKHAS